MYEYRYRNEDTNNFLTFLSIDNLLQTLGSCSTENTNDSLGVVSHVFRSYFHSVQTSVVGRSTQHTYNVSHICQTPHLPKNSSRSDIPDFCRSISLALQDC